MKSIQVKNEKSNLDSIDCIYVINLDSRPDKWNRVKAIFDERGLTVNRVSAVNGKALPDTLLKELCGPYNIRFEKGHYGCLLSHLSVLKDAYDRGFNTIWVCEDDIEILEDLNSIPKALNELAHHDANWDIFYTDQRPRMLYEGKVMHVNTRAYDPRPDEKVLPVEHYLKKTPIGKNLIRIRERTGTTSMVISRSGMKKLLDYFTHVFIHTPIDIDMHFAPDLREYTPQKDLVSNWVESTSDITDYSIPSEPTTPSNLLDLALSLQQKGELKKARTVYRQALKEESSKENLFWAHYQLAEIQKTLGETPEEVSENYHKAHEYFPTRIEPLYRLGQHYPWIGNYLLGYLTAKEGLSTPRPENISQNESRIYDWGLLFELSICSYYVGKLDEAISTSIQLLDLPQLPEEIRSSITQNLAFYKSIGTQP